MALLRPSASMITWTNTSTGATGEVRFNAVVREGHKVENEVTGFPVDTGFIVSDHNIRKNRKLTFEFQSMKRSLGETELNSLTELHQTISTIGQEGYLCTVVTNLGVYNNCAIILYETSQDVETIHTLPGFLEFSELNVIGAASSGSSKTASKNVSGQEETNVNEAIGDFQGIPPVDSSLEGFTGG